MVHLDGRDLSSRQMQMVWELIKRDVDCKAVVFPAVEDVQAVCGKGCAFAPSLEL